MNAGFLLKSLAARPQSEPIDAVKWLYQSEFGCGHMLPPEEACAARIAQEMAQTPSQTSPEPPFEPLGNGLCRLNLMNPLTRTQPPERIARMMRVTDGRVRGTQAGFDAKLALLAALAERAGANPAQDAETTNSAAPTREPGADAPSKPRLPFDAQALAATVRAFRAAPPAPPSHSERYRLAYAPAYRVVLRRFGEALPVLAQVEARLAADGRVLLVLDGDCASGKTTLAALLHPLYDANVIHMDDFFLPFALRTPERMAEAGGNVHYERFAQQVLGGLLRGDPLAYDAYDCQTGAYSARSLPKRPVTIVEGSYALHPRFADAYAALRAVRMLLSVDSAEQQRRILARNGAAMLKRFETEWIPLEKRYFQAYHSAQAGVFTLVSARYTEDEPQEADAP